LSPTAPRKPSPAARPPGNAPRTSKMPTKKIPKIDLGSAVALAAVCGLLLLGACTPRPPQTLSEGGGPATGIGPDANFTPAALIDPWWRSPSDAGTRFATVNLDGTTVLRVDAPGSDKPGTSVIGRRLAVPLLAMPYLQWAWYLEPASYEGGP